MVFYRILVDNVFLGRPSHAKSHEAKKDYLWRQPFILKHWKMHFELKIKFCLPLFIPLSHETSLKNMQAFCTVFTIFLRAAYHEMSQIKQNFEGSNARIAKHFSKNDYFCCKRLSQISPRKIV